MANRRSWLTLLRCIALLSLTAGSAYAQLGTVGGPGFIVFGRVYLPDGKPASRVKVYLEMPSGLSRYIPTDDGGNYEFRGIDRGRYKVKAVNPDNPEQYSDVAESDSTRAYANRVQVDVYLRLPAHYKNGSDNPGTVSVAEATQAIPKPARQAYEHGIKFTKENKPDKALTSFSEALQLYPKYFQAFTERGNLLMQTGKLDESLADFDQALQINSTYSPALRGAGYCNIQRSKFEDAIEQLQKSLLYEPKIALTHMLLGYANLSLDRYKQAEKLLQQAIKLGGDNIIRARVYLAEVYAHEQKFKEAADEIRTYLTLKPEAADAASLRKLETDWRTRSKSAKN